MSCVHLRRLYKLCEDEDIKLGGTDLLHIVCTQCGVKETCPDVLMDEYESDELEPPASQNQENSEEE